jgi:hypothetical protein
MTSNSKGRKLVLLLALLTLFCPLAFSQTPSGKRYHSVSMTPVHIHIEPVAFDSRNQPEVDLRPTIHKMEIPIRNQGNRGTCSIFATTFLIDYMYAKDRDVKHELFSEEYLNDVKNLATGDDWDGGMFTDIYTGFEKYGIVKLDLDRYRETFNPAEKVSKDLLSDGEKFTPRFKAKWIKVWNNTTGLEPSELSAVLDELRKGVPVATGLRWPNNFETETIKGIPVMKTPGPNGVTDGHSIAFVGFKKDAAFPGGGYLIFRNSWGKSFQEDGYGYMPFKFAMKYANDIVKYVPPKEFTPPHPPHAGQPRI